MSDRTEDSNRECSGEKTRIIDAGVFKTIDFSLASHTSFNLTKFDTMTAIHETWSLDRISYRVKFTKRLRKPP